MLGLTLPPSKRVVLAAALSLLVVVVLLAWVPLRVAHIDVLSRGAGGARVVAPDDRIQAGAAAAAAGGRISDGPTLVGTVEAGMASN